MPASTAVQPPAVFSGIDPSGIDPSGIDPSGIEPSGMLPRGIDPSGLSLEVGRPQVLPVDGRAGELLAGDGELGGGHGLRAEGGERARPSRPP